MLPEPRRSNVIDFATQDRSPLLGSDLQPLRRKQPLKDIGITKVPWPLTCERISVLCSFVCLVTSVILRINKGNDLKVRISRETLLFSNDTDVEDGMRLIHSTWNKHCEDKHKLLLQVPKWQDNESGLVMHSSTYAFDIPIFPLAFAVFLTSIIFQGWRCWQYNKLQQDNKLYKPEKGPEFSRWLEYFFTLPLQILIISSSFGFATVDSLIGQSGMQAALVLLGYNIEQQVRKIYKRRALKQEQGQSYTNKQERFQHLFAKWNVADIRTWVYLFFAWALHVAIWGIPNVTGFGIGGKYTLLQNQLEKCVKTMKIPDAVTVFYWLQYFWFTVFGLVCSAHVLWAQTRDISKPERDWTFVSGLYTVLSVTAKTALEAGLVLYVGMYKEWDMIDEAHTQKLHNQTCWSINPVV